MYIIVRGTVSIRIDREGEEVELVRRGTGDVVGEFALLNPGPRSASVLAVTEVEALLLTGTAFETLRRNHVRKSKLRVRVACVLCPVCVYVCACVALRACVPCDTVAMAAAAAVAAGGCGC